uniref:Uncharacterized protein n=1 Tax=Rhizophora mucronata TaxID=61149 RepID=A0A2P2MXN1_RHIMU
MNYQKYSIFVYPNISI